MPKTNYHHGDLYQNLIDAAIELIRDDGVRTLSLRQVARRVGVSHNAPYRHFADKDELLSAVAEQGFHGLCQAMETALQTVEGHAIERLKAIGKAYVAFAIANPAHYRLMFGENRGDLSSSLALDQAADASFRVLVQTIQGGQESGVFRVVDPIDMARVAWSLVHGQAMLALDQRLPIEPSETHAQFLEFSLQLLIQGIAK